MHSIELPKGHDKFNLIYPPISQWLSRRQDKEVMQYLSSLLDLWHGCQILLCLLESPSESDGQVVRAPETLLIRNRKSEGEVSAEKWSVSLRYI